MASPAHAFSLKQTAGGANVTWRQKEVQIDYDRSVLAHPGLLAALDRALAVWRDAPGAPSLVRGSTVRRTPANDGQNVVFVSDGPFEPAKGALAVTLVSYDERSGAILDADIVLNGAYNFETLGDHNSTRRRSPPAYDMARVLGHELGHVLGLDDERQDRGALMFLGTGTDSRLSAQLGDDDIEGVMVLYAPVPSADRRGCAVRRASDARRSGTTWSDAVLILVAVAVTLALRRRRPRLPSGHDDG